MTDDLRQRARDLIKFQRNYGSVAIAQVVEELLRAAELMRDQCDWQSDRTEEQARRVAELEAIIAKHDICHDLHGKVGRDEFEEGCRRETVKEFGSCGWAERIAELESENGRLRVENSRLKAANGHLQQELVMRPER